MSLSGEAKSETRHFGLSINSVVANLPELLLGHLASDERTAIIVETGCNRYVQFLVTEDRDLILECVSNRYLEVDESLSLDEELRLLGAGFEPPETDEEPHPNWWWKAEGVPDVMKASRLAAFALQEVFGLQNFANVVLIERPLPVRR